MSNNQNTPQNLAKKIARQMAQEPGEILKQAGEQIAGIETAEQTQGQERTKEKPIEEKQLEQKIQNQGQRQLQALEQEIKDMSKSKLVTELQQKINEGQAVTLIDYPELSQIERDYLSSQMIMVKQRQQVQNVGQPLEEPSSKPDRKFAGEGLGAKRQQQRVEKPLPPSG